MTVRLMFVALILGVSAVSDAAPVPKAVVEPKPTREQYWELHKQFCSIKGFNTIYGFGPYFRIILHSDPHEDELPKFPDVPFTHEMELSCDNLSAKGFRRLKPTRKLRTLVLLCSERVEAALDHLTKFDRLVHLGLQGGFTDDALKLVATLERLTELDLTTGTHLAAEGLKHLRGMKRLARLHLYGERFDDDRLAALAGLDELTHIELRETSITDAGLKSLRAFPKLRSVRWCGRDLTVKGMTILASLPELAEISLPNAYKFDDQQLLLFAQAKKLTALHADATALTDAGLRDFLAHAPITLTKLNLHNNSGKQKLTDAGTVGLERFVHLTELEFWGSQVGSATLERAAKLKKLTHLSVYGSPNVTDDGVKLLRGLDRLEVLNLSSTGVTFKTLDEVANWKHLKRLALMLFYGYGELTEEGVDRLRKARPDLAVGSEGS